MKLTKTLLVIPVIGLLAACGQTEMTMKSDDPLIGERQTEAPKDFVVYPDDRPSIPDGRLVWDKQNCASCHGSNGVGTSTGPALNDPLAMGKLKPVEMYKKITYGKGGNEASDPHNLQPKISNKEIWNLVFYTKSLAIPPLTTAEIDEINAVFGSNCAVCHGTKGDGDGPLARNLEPWPANFQTFRRFYDRTDDTLYDHIANGIKWEGMPNFLGKEDRKKNVKFDQAYIRKLVQYVRNFHVSNEATVVAENSAASGSATPAASPAAPAESKKEEAAPESNSRTETKSEGEQKTEAVSDAEAPKSGAKDESQAEKKEGEGK